LTAAGADDAGLVGEHDCLDAVAQSEFHKQACDVCFHGGLGDEEVCGDLGVGSSACDESKDFELARCQLV
jgi:hypothetical protein